MNKIYLFAIASILATASLMVDTITSAAIARGPTTAESEMGSTMMDTGSTNMTGRNMTSGTGNSTAPM